ncbi:MAG: hypothetical protein HYS04_15700 [Acidobacteria bacterium]|nr:hypothetical protein [Acidobacteriota bacterium]
MPDQQQFLTEIQSDNPDVRFAAWRRAGEMEAAAVGELAKLAASANPGIAKAAREAIATLVHSVGKEPSGGKRAQVVKQLLAVSRGDTPAAVRRVAFRNLSLIAGADSVPAIARSLNDADLAEEAAFCLERIPGKAATDALIAAFPKANDNFKPRMLAALGHRRAAEAARLIADAMRSSDKEIALAATKAWGRIGAKSAARLPDTAGLSDWQKIEHFDAQLRYADAQASGGDRAEAMRIYQLALDRPEPHLQCAGIVGLAKLGTPEAATRIFPKLKSTHGTVRITAQNAWKSMAG